MRMFNERFPNVARKMPLIIIIAILAALIVGGIALSSTYAFRTSPNPVAKQDANQVQKAGGSVEQKAGKGGAETKGTFRVISVNANSIEARFIFPEEKNGQTTTLALTSDTAFEPDRNALAAGKAISVLALINEDQSLTLTEVTIDPELYSTGRITSIEGNTIVIQSTYGPPTIHLTPDAAFSRLNRANGQKGTASLSDIKVGTEITAEGFVNDDGSIDAFEVVVEEGQYPEKKKE